MDYRLLFLLLTLSLSSCFPPATDAQSLIFLDKFGCTHLRCKWQLEGEKCKVMLNFGKRPIEFPFELLNGESEEDFLKRMKIRFPLNTFTIVNNVQMDEKCTRKKLSCTMLFGENGYQLLVGEQGFEQFFERLLDPRIPTHLRTSFNC